MTTTKLEILLPRRLMHRDPRLHGAASGHVSDDGPRVMAKCHVCEIFLLEGEDGVCSWCAVPRFLEQLEAGALRRAEKKS